MNAVVRFIVPFLVLALVATVALPAISAEPVDGSGNLYEVRSLRGVAVMRSAGEVVEVEASLWAVVESVEARKNLTFFRVIDGEIRIGDKSYDMVGGWWAGIYSIPSGRAFYEGVAFAEDGARLRFILHSKDLCEGDGVVKMVIKGVFSELSGNLTTRGKMFIEAVRVKL